jgi:hypothetical protein
MSDNRQMSVAMQRLVGRSSIFSSPRRPWPNASRPPRTRRELHRRVVCQPLRYARHDENEINKPLHTNGHLSIVAHVGGSHSSRAETNT